MFRGLLRAVGLRRDDKVAQMPETEVEKIDAIFEIVREVRDELRPIGPDGQRSSRLESIIGGISRLSPGERAEVVKELESLEVDDQICEFLEKARPIQEVAKQINRSYGYTAARLRTLMRESKVMRKRDAVTRKYVYLRV
ncbi:MAG: hypothetical protein GOV00_01765 [Candidatus Altiarchaeota archaeon]|nr:hypothetical protein [Candidatus Altiarchaeota archaeon]